MRGDHRRDEALVLAPELGEGTCLLLQVEPPNSLQDFGLLGVHAGPPGRHKLLGVLVGPPDPVPQHVRVGVPRSVRVQVRDSTVRLGRKHRQS